MRKTNMMLVIALGLAVLAGLTLNQANGVSAQNNSAAGLVVAYTPGQSITIVDKNGQQSEFALDPSVTIEPAEEANSLGAGSVVTIVVNDDTSKENQIAVRIVIHTSTSGGLKELLPSATPLVKNTPVPTDMQATPTPKVVETMTPVETVTATSVEAFTMTPTTSADAEESDPTQRPLNENTFIEWLRSLFQQILSRP